MARSFVTRWATVGGVATSGTNPARVPRVFS